MGEAKLLLSRQEAASALGVSLSKFDQLVDAGELNYVQVGRRKRFLVRELERWIDDNMRRVGESE